MFLFYLNKRYSSLTLGGIHWPAVPLDGAVNDTGGTHFQMSPPDPARHHVRTSRLQVNTRHTLILTHLNLFQTRMHSSRMRTGRSLTVCRSLLPGGGGCLLWWVSTLVGCLLRGVSAPGGCLLRACLLLGGCLLPRGGVVSQHALRQTPPPVNRITDTSKNITTTSLRPVISVFFFKNNLKDISTFCWWGRRYLNFFFNEIFGQCLSQSLSRDQRLRLTVLLRPNNLIYYFLF